MKYTSSTFELPNEIHQGLGIEACRDHIGEALNGHIVTERIHKELEYRPGVGRAPTIKICADNQRICF